MWIVKYWDFAACSLMVLLWTLFVATSGDAIPHTLTLVFIACLALSLL